MTAKTATTKRPVSPIQIVGKAGNQAVYVATSASEPGRVHLVTWSPTVRQWECDCAAFTFRKRCAHLRELSARLADEMRRRDAEVVAVAIKPDDGWIVTPAGMAALQAWRQRKEAETKRATAPRRTGAAFSLLK